MGRLVRYRNAADFLPQGIAEPVIVIAGDIDNPGAVVRKLHEFRDDVEVPPGK